MTYKKLAAFLFALALYGFMVQAALAANIRVGIPAQSISQVAFYVGLERGYFKEEGLDVQLILMPAPIANVSVIAGEVHFTSVPNAGLVSAVRGAPLKILSATFNKPLFWLFSKKEIKTPQDLKGKRLGTAGLASVTGTLAVDYVKKHGMTPGRDVLFINSGTQPAVFSALVGGAIDAAVFVMPWSFRAEDAGFNQLTSFLHESEEVHLAGGLVARKAFLEGDRELAKKFVRAAYKGYVYARENREGTIPILARNVQIPGAMAARMYKEAKPAMTEDWTVGVQEQQKTMDLVLGLQGMKKGPALGDVYDFSLVEEVRAELKAKGWKP